MLQVTTALKKILALKKRLKIVQGGSCFVSGTLVTMSDGSYKPIQEIKIGDKVLSIDDNLGNVSSTVYAAWSSEAAKPILSITINSETIRATYDHKFYTPEGYKELYKIAWGNMEASQRLQLKLLCEQYGQTLNYESSQCEENSCDEASSSQHKTKQQQALLQHENSIRQEVNTSSQSSSSNIFTKPKEFTPGRSLERRFNRQQGGKSRMGYSLGESKKIVQERSESGFDGRSEPVSEDDRQSGDRNTPRMGYDTQKKPKTTGSRLWSLGSDYKRLAGGQNLSPSSIEQIQVQQPEKIFAISVVNVNYFVGKSRLNVSNSSSKTFSILMILIDTAQREDGATISVMSESLPHLKLGAIRDFMVIMKAQEYWNEGAWNKTNSIYTFPNGSIIEFFSADDKGKVHGPRRDYLFVNECNNVQFEIYRQASLRTKKAIYLDFNPTHEFYVHEKLVDREDADFIKLNYKDNEALSQTIIDEIESYRDDPNWYLVYGLGEVGKLEGVIYENWEIVDGIPPEAVHKRRGLDFGFRDGGGIVDVYEYNGGFLLDEVGDVKGLHDKDIANTIRKSEGLPSVGENGYFFESTKVLTIADSSEPKSIEAIANHGVKIIGAEKGKDSVMYGIKAIQQYELYVTSRSTALIKALRGYKWKVKKSTGEELGEPEHALSHMPDAFRYAITDIIDIIQIRPENIKLGAKESLLDQLMERDEERNNKRNRQSSF